MEKLQTIITILMSGKLIPSQYKDHPLKGKYDGFRDLHIEPDWVLVSCIKKDIVYLSAIGSHSYVLKM